MLQLILTQTPIWVWALLVFLVYRGFVMFSDRIVTIRMMMIMPIIMFTWSIQGMLVRFGAKAFAWLAWLGMLLIVSLLGVRSTDAVKILPANTVWLRGSRWPLVQMLVMFCCKYVENVLLVMQPSLVGDTTVAMVFGAIYGALNACFLMNLARLFILNRQQTTNTAQVMRVSKGKSKDSV